MGTIPQTYNKGLAKCKRWVNACGCEGFTVEKIKRWTHYIICSKHFAGGKGPTQENPDPIPANYIHTPKKPLILIGYFLSQIRQNTIIVA